MSSKTLTMLAGDLRSVIFFALDKYSLAFSCSTGYHEWGESHDVGHIDTGSTNEGIIATELINAYYKL